MTLVLTADEVLRLKQQAVRDAEQTTAPGDKVRNVIPALEAAGPGVRVVRYRTVVRQGTCQHIPNAENRLLI